MAGSGDHRQASETSVQVHGESGGLSIHRLSQSIAQRVGGETARDEGSIHGGQLVGGVVGVTIHTIIEQVAVIGGLGLGTIQVCFPLQFLTAKHHVHCAGRNKELGATNVT